MHKAEKGIYSEDAHVEQRLAHDLPYGNERIAREKVMAYKPTVDPRQMHDPERPLDSDNRKEEECTNDEGYGKWSEECHSQESLEVTKFAFYEHNHRSRIYASRAYQTALTAEHTFVKFLIGTAILATTHGGMQLAEVEVGDISRRARCRTRPTPYAGLQLRHLGDDGVALAQVVVIHINGTRAADAISEVQVTHSL